MKKQIITLMCATALLSSCHIYKSYDRPEDITAAGLYRDTTAVNDTLAADTANFGNLPWREVFTDPQLQALIEQALANNPDLRSAALNVKKAEAALMSARLAYAPTLALSPQGTVSSWDKGKATQTYSLPVTASWQIDLFGQILNPKRGAQVSLKQTQFYEQAVQTQVIANVANMYYTLLMLDRQLQITESTADILKKNVETVEAMKDAGIYNTTSAGVEQTRAAYAQVLASLPGMLERTILVNGFSKAFAMTGWRLGYACGPEAVIKIMTKIHQSAIMSAPTTSQYAAITALKECDGEIDRMRDEYNMRRRLVVRSFNDMGLTCFEPRGAFYAFPCIKSTGMSSQEFCTKLLEQKHVAIIPGDAFGASGEGYCRVSYAYSVEHLTEAMKRIREFLKENGINSGEQ